VAESYLRLRFREEVRRADGRVPRLAVFAFDEPLRFAVFRPLLAFVARRTGFLVRFAERDDLLFFADGFLRAPPLFFGETFRAVLLGFCVAAFFAGRLPSDEADVGFRAEAVVDLDAAAVGVATVEISLVLRDGVAGAAG
jgi:hypothetical protein